MLKALICPSFVMANNIEESVPHLRVGALLEMCPGLITIQAVNA